ncbi:MAG: InlB B-repeat-containing protein [Acholeplasmataceae bacterium]|nr:InlB B-repeat-containing protein [Acholeplasmataceae bacterium]
MKKALFIILFVFILTGCSGTHNVNITYETNGGTILKPTEVINSNSLEWYPLVPQKNNSFFVNWYLNPELTDIYSPEALANNKSLTLYAKYIDADQDQYFIVSFVSMGGTFTPNQLVQTGSLLVEPTAPVKSGYVFLHWVYAVSATDKQGYVDFLEPITEHLVLEAVYMEATPGRKE